MEELEKESYWCERCAQQTGLRVTYWWQGNGHSRLETLEWCQVCEPITVEE